MLNTLFNIKKMEIAINKRFFDGKLPPVILTIQQSAQNKSDAWFWADKWEDKDGNKYDEINLNPSVLNRGKIEVATLLLHQMIHHHCHVIGVEDTSRKGRYHNIKFKKECKNRGLIVEKTESDGYSITKPSEELIELVNGLDLDDVFSMTRLNDAETNFI